MVAYNFQQQFADDVEYGIKKQTIRKKARCKVGDELQLYTGMRTKKCRKLGNAVCTKITPIELHATEMFLNGKRLLVGNALRDECEDRDNDFAKKDGFGDYMEMADWFHKRYGSLPFSGFLIQWRSK